MFPEFILRAFQTVVFGISSDILISEGSHLKSMLRTVSVSHTNQSYTSVCDARHPPEGKRWSLRGLASQLSQHEEPDGGNLKGKVARESELRAGLGCWPVASPACKFCSPLTGPSGNAGGSIRGYNWLSAHCVPGMGLSTLCSFSHLRGQIFSICSLHRSVTMWYLNDYSIRDD